MIQLHVPDMTCGHCASTITKAVRDLDGAARCEIDLPSRTVRIESARPAAEFVEAVAEAGYTPALGG